METHFGKALLDICQCFRQTLDRFPKVLICHLLLLIMLTFHMERQSMPVSCHNLHNFKREEAVLNMEIHLETQREIYHQRLDEVHRRHEEYMEHEAR